MRDLDTLTNWMGGARRLLPALGLVVAVSSGCGAVTPPSGAPLSGTSSSGVPVATTGSGADRSSQLADAVLATLPVKGRAAATGYERSAFGDGWADEDHDGCSTREEILQRDLTHLTYRWSGGCQAVATGQLDDPYTGRTIAFRRGTTTSEAVQIDHVVALLDAWRTGAQRLTAQRRRALANDPLELLAVDGATNQGKGAGDAATWLPPNRAYRCSYVARQIAVKAKYGLWVTAAEKAAMQRVLAACPAQAVPAS